MPSSKFLSSRPEFKGNDERLGFLYSAFPSRKSANPDGYAQAVAWWKGLLCDLAWEGGQSGKGEETDRLILNVDEKLREVLRWDGIGTPSALGEVVKERQFGSSVERVVYDDGKARWPLPIAVKTSSASELVFPILVWRFGDGCQRSAIMVALKDVYAPPRISGVVVGSAVVENRVAIVTGRAQNAAGNSLLLAILILCPRNKRDGNQGYEVKGAWTNM
ncbi:hypothetical protein BT69DRAFT_1296769 [Atractiella rhizophila]|nr:hypothetical protein BT69DRAFT_1296769 [Atractiella rhizophila]